VLHLGRRQLRIFREHRAEAAQISAVEDLATLDLPLQRRPAGEAVSARDRELSRCQRDAVRHRSDLLERRLVAALRRPQQILRLMAQLLQIGA
jgi:hypothetical protein